MKTVYLPQRNRLVLIYLQKRFISKQYFKYVNDNNFYP